jgi:integrase
MASVLATGRWTEMATPADVTADPRTVADYMDAAVRENTQRSYAAGIRHFEQAWGGLLPATPPRIAEYLAAFGASQSINTLRSRLAALAHWHQEHGFADPTRSPIVRQTLKGIRAVHNVKERQAEPLQLRELTQLDRWFGQALAAARAQDDRALGLRLSRDRALILLGFWKGFRGDDLLRLQVEHLTIVPGQGMTLYLPRSKGDRQARGTTHQVPALSRLCPVTAVQAWCEVATLSAGPLFRAVDTWGAVRPTALHANSLIGVLRRAFARAGIAAAETYSGHSLRRGFAGWATGNGWDAKALMEYVGWKDVQSAMRYVDRPDAFGRQRIEQALTDVAAGPAAAMPLLPTPAPLTPVMPTHVVALTVQLSSQRPRGSTARARRTIEFVCLQRYGAVPTDAARGVYSLTVAAADELDLSEVMGALIEDVHRIADNHGAAAEAVAVYDNGRLRWD